MRAGSIARLLVALLSIALSSIAAACSVDVRSGHYACSVAADCPRAAPFCRSDDRCHSTPGETERDAATAVIPDSGPPMLRDTGPLPDASRPCTTHGDCTLSGSQCIQSICRRPCVRGGPACGAEEECVAATTAGVHGNVCLPIRIASEGNYAPCSGTCPSPFECVHGNCVRDCNALGDQCLSPERCVRDPPPPNGTTRGLCLVTCGSGAPPCPAGASCVRPPGETTDVCIVW